MYPLDKFPHFKVARLSSYLSNAAYPGKKMGAVIHKKNKFLAIGINSYEKTHPIQGNGLRPFLHAEVAAILKRRHYDDLDSCSISIYREVQNMPALAKPCPQCQKIMKAAGIKKVYFSIPSEPYYEVMRL